MVVRRCFLAQICLCMVYFYDFASFLKVFINVHNMQIRRFTYLTIGKKACVKL